MMPQGVSSIWVGKMSNHNYILCYNCTQAQFQFKCDRTQACIDSDLKALWSCNNKSAITKKGVFNGFELWNLTLNVNKTKYRRYSNFTSPNSTCYSLRRNGWLSTNGNWDACSPNNVSGCNPLE